MEFFLLSLTLSSFTLTVPGLVNKVCHKYKTASTECDFNAIYDDEELRPEAGRRKTR